ncbi:hypothetical protein BD779DRAFT_1659908 [Infundibulicybe gibba]|nr:hypothetical protein BD779DRAFT_1659908 [Infundibulicybe gibba]
MDEPVIPFVPWEKKTTPTPTPTTTREIPHALSTWVGQRINTVLDHLETEVFQCKNGEAPEPCCILLQEVHINALKVVLQHSWIKSHFATTPISREKWPFGATYGNVTLISRSITVVKAQSLEFGSSSMWRTGLMVDVKLSAPEPHARTGTLRIINTHLESLPTGAVARPTQMSLLAKFIKEDNLQGGIIAGDMNSIDPDESTFGDKNEIGFTWGYQGGGEYPPARFDKIVYLPRRGYKVEEPRRIGIGLKSGDADRKSSAIWASDHYGLDTHLRILR